MLWNQDLRDLRDPCLWPDPNLRCMVWSCWNRWNIFCCKLMRRWNLWFFYTWKWYISISSIRFLQFHTIATCVKSNVVFLVEPSQLGVFLVKQTEMYIFPDASRFVFLQPLSKLQSLRTSTLVGGHGDFNAVCLWIFLGDGLSNSPGVQRCWSLGIFWWDAYGCWISGIWYCWCFF